jgi:hypothetical protein
MGNVGGDRIPPSLESAHIPSCPKFRKNTNGVIDAAAAAVLPFAICGPGGDYSLRDTEGRPCVDAASSTAVPRYHPSISQSTTSHPTRLSGLQASYISLLHSYLFSPRASAPPLRVPQENPQPSDVCHFPSLRSAPPNSNSVPQPRTTAHTPSAFRAERILWRAIINILRSVAPSWFGSRHRYNYLLGLCSATKRLRQYRLDNHRRHRH